MPKISLTVLPVERTPQPPGSGLTYREARELLLKAQTFNVPTAWIDPVAESKSYAVAARERKTADLR